MGDVKFIVQIAEVFRFRIITYEYLYVMGVDRDSGMVLKNLFAGCINRTPFMGWLLYSISDYTHDYLLDWE